MKKSTIIVGNEYSEAFKSITELINGGCFKDLPYSARDGIISDGTNEFILSDETKSNSSELKVAMLKTGATWFDCLRNHETNNTDAIWTTFIENVGIEYHKRFSVVEYEKKITSQFEESKQIENATTLVNHFVDLFYEQYSNKIVVQPRETKETDDIYGISMRIELSGGSGASLPILCKVYFSKNGNKMFPIASNSAGIIEESLDKFIPSGDKNEPEEIKLSDNVIDIALNALNDIVNSDTINLGDLIYISNKSDEQSFKGLIEKMSHDAFEIECQRIDVLYITHVKAELNKFDVYSSGNKLFQLVVGLNNSISLYCANCGLAEPIVDRNAILIKGEIEKSIMLDTSLESFGLSDEQIELIKQNSSVSEHFMNIECPRNPSNSLCKTSKCKSQLFEVQDGENVVYKCKDCDYPEMVLFGLNGEIQYVPNLVFVCDLLKMLPKNTDGISQCASCGRYFSSSVLKNGKCPTCFKSDRCDESEDGKQLYKKYRTMLPLKIRIANISKHKGCVEDGELIYFKLGIEKYVFNKLNIQKVGYIEPPKKIF